MAKWYSMQQLLSYNALFNIVLSGRGGGKTFEATKRMIELFKKKGKQSAYIRRNKVEMDDVKPTFFMAIKEHYPNDTFEVKGDIGYINGLEAIHFIPLSTSSNKKSKAYPKVDFALFDEYIITDNGYKHYLKNEMVLLFDICESIFRSRDDWRIVFLSNSVSYVCPLFSFFDIEPKGDKRFHRFKDGLILLEIFESEEFLEDKKKTRFARLLEGTAYYDYAINNKVLEDTNDFIKKDRSGKHLFMCSFVSNNFEVGVWLNEENIYYIDEKIDKFNKSRYAILNEDMREGLTHVKYSRNTTTVKRIKQAYHNGEVFFSTQEVKKFFERTVIRYL